MSAAAMANCAAGSSGVGPGVNNRVFRIIFPSLWSGLCQVSNHIIHTYVINVSDKL
jgi:hypothetical protein